jgi:DNA-binding SARP family transcriptional activator
LEAPWRIELLGWLRARQGARVVTRFGAHAAGALLGYLSYYAQRPHRREELVELLWPECDPEVGRHRLRKALSSLRRELEPAGTVPGSVILADRDTVQLSPACVTDVAEFEAALRAAGRAGSSPQGVERLARAVEIHWGPLLPGFSHDWILQERQWLIERYFQALSQLLEHLEQGGEFESALQYAHLGISTDPLREEAHRDLMRLYAAVGQPGAALRQYQQLERVLQQELAAEPDTATRALARAIADQVDSRCAPEVWGKGSEPRPSGSGVTAPRAVSHAEAPRPAPGPASWASSRLQDSQLEPVGGAVPLDSPFYVARTTDREFAAAITRQDSIVLVKGPSQAGKTSLLARGVQHAREKGARVVLTDFGMFNAVHLESIEALLLTLAQSIADQLDLEVSPADAWEARRGANPNFRRYLEREVLGIDTAPLVWGLDQVDRLFTCDFGPELFGLFRSWHNHRALHPTGPWSRLTLAMAYATEAHFLITDINQSPFNVGTRLSLEDFTREQATDLNRRYGEPLRDESELDRYFGLVGGHPYLVRRGLHEMAEHGTDIVTFEARAGSGDWIYGDHLRRLLVLLARDSELCSVVRGVLEGRPCPSLESFYRLRSAGVVIGDSEEDARPRCQLYARFFHRHLP